MLVCSFRTILHSSLNYSGSGTRLFYSTKPTYSMSCRIAKYILNFLAANKLYFGGALASVLAILALYMRVSTTRERKQRTQELVDGVISVLIEQVKWVVGIHG